MAKPSTHTCVGSWETCRDTHWLTPSKRTFVPSSSLISWPSFMFSRATFFSRRRPRATGPSRTPTGRARRRGRGRRAACRRRRPGRSAPGADDVRTLPCRNGVGANSPVMASWRVRRCTSSVTPGWSNFVAPSDEHRGRVDRAPLGVLGALLAVREGHRELRRVAVAEQVDAVAGGPQRRVDLEAVRAARCPCRGLRRTGTGCSRGSTPARRSAVYRAVKSLTFTQNGSRSVPSTRRPALNES